VVYPVTNSGKNPTCNNCDAKLIENFFSQNKYIKKTEAASFISGFLIN
jgi:hypothetical protein